LTPLLIPPVEERTAIIEYLREEMSKSDTLFNEVAKSVELLKEHRTALISAAVTGKIDVRNQAA
jgi:type I restriction enzyme S subunit